jgi:hypothetical protein
VDEQPKSRELAPAKPAVIVARETVDATREDARASAAGISKGRKLLALAVAAMSDAVSAFTAFSPPAQLVVDSLTAVVLFVVLGFRWPLLPVLVIEAVPVAAAFPTWLLAVGVIVGVTPTK